MLRHQLFSVSRSVKVIQNKSLLASCSLFHTGQPTFKHKQVDYDGTAARDAAYAAEKARIAAYNQTNNVATPITDQKDQKESNFSWKGLMKLREKVKDLMAKYGAIAFVTYSSLYLTMAGTYFLLLDNGVVSTAMVGIDHMETAMKVGNQ